MSYGNNTMGVIYVILMSLLPASILAGKEVCCDKIGCFNSDDNGPMSHLPNPSCPEDIGLTFYLFTRQNPEKPAHIALDDIPEAFDAARTTIVAVHGWMSDNDVSWMPGLVEGLLEHFDANVIVADWSQGSNKFYYPKSAANVQTVGAAIGYLLVNLHDDRHEDYYDMWCIGFSLGAHACGHAGMRTRGKIGRITGMDPAGPKFSGRDIKNGINPEAATFVDVIHTDGDGLISYYGLMEPRGHMDFYPNGGEDQPGCYFGRKKRDAQLESSQVNCIDFDGWIDPESCPYNPFVGCSHFRAVYYFIDSLSHQECHVSRFKCPDSENIPRNCEATVDTYMGVNAHLNQHKEGLFYLETGKSSPYCRY